MRGVYPRALVLASLAALPSAVMLVASSFWPDARLMQPNGFFLGSDFVNYWTGGRLALEGRLDVIYDLAAYNEVLRQWFSPDLRVMNFSYPPHALLFLSLVGALPYLVALTLWSCAGAVAFIAISLAAWPQRVDRTLLAALVLAPVLWVNIVFGQFGLLLALVFVGALRALPAQPVLAGILIGLLTVKPQLGMLLPLVLILMGAWRAFAAAAVTAVLLVGASIAVFGIEPWQVYIAETMPFQWQFIEIMNGFYRFQMITPYTLFWFLGVPAGIALALHWTVAALVAVTVGMVVAGRASWPLKATVVAFGSVLVAPYVLSYDLAIPLAALVWCLRSEDMARDAKALALVGAVWALPFGLGIFAQIEGVPLLPAVLLATYAWLAAQALGWRVPVKTASQSARA
jgi:alpha-1,2-mannosyltransferase